VKRMQHDLYFGWLDECEERVKNGEENGCHMEEVIKRQDEFGMSREMVGYLGGVGVEAGSHTTAYVLQSLVLALVAFPEAQRKAHAEIDQVVGGDRLPTADDFANLPYVQAVIKETHRFRPAVPLGLPHATLADEEYRGYVVPKGSTIFCNIWGLFHDPELFADPDTFNPDRYILTEFGTRPGVDDGDFRHTLPFGFGRRICPGINLANNSLVRTIIFTTELLLHCWNRWSIP